MDHTILFDLGEDLTYASLTYAKFTVCVRLAGKI